MEREIIFRAKDKDNNWVYGDLIHGVGAYKNGVFILPMTINLAYVPNCDPINGVRVDENTVCQFTGLKDAKGKDIYEGDIIESKYGKRHFIKFDENKSAFVAIPIDDDDFCSPCTLYKNWIIKFSKRVIGNLFDNPEY